MPVPSKFRLDFIREEQHLMLPTVTSIKLTQNLYDTLFQYAITSEEEDLLKKFINMLETHIKRRDQAPFSMPVSELQFLNEGLDELRLLNWLEVPVAIFHISLDADIKEEDYPDELEKVLNYLEKLMIFSQPESSTLVQVYPFVLVR